MSGSPGFFPHQIEGSAWLANHDAGMLWWDTRTGKTRTTLAAARALGRRLIVVAPAIARGVWGNEHEELGGDPGDLTTLFGRTNRVATGPVRDAQIIVVGWDTLQSWMPFLKGLSGYALALDESHEHASNYTTKRWRAADALGDNASHVWLLSGTPYRTSALDFWSQLRLLGRRIPYVSQAEFAAQHCYQRRTAFHPRGWDWAGLRNEEALIASAPIHRVREQGQMPPRRVTWLEEPGVSLSYDPHDGADLARARNRLSKLKAQRVAEMVLTEFMAYRPIVVFGWHHEFLDEVSARLQAPVIDGSTPSWRRDELRALHAEGRIPILVCQMQAAGIAVDFAAAQTAIFGEVDWNETTHRQAEGRLRGPRQKGNVVYHYVVTRHSVDEYVWKVRLDKGRAMDRLDAAVG